MSDVKKEQPNLVLLNPNHGKDVKNGGGITPAMGNAALRLQRLLGTDNLLLAASEPHHNLNRGSLGNRKSQENPEQLRKEMPVTEFFEQTGAHEGFVGMIKTVNGIRIGEYAPNTVAIQAFDSFSDELTPDRFMTNTVACARDINTLLELAVAKNIWPGVNKLRAEYPEYKVNLGGTDCVETNKGNELELIESADQEHLVSDVLPFLQYRAGIYDTMAVFAAIGIATGVAMHSEKPNRIVNWFSSQRENLLGSIHNVRAEAIKCLIERIDQIAEHESTSDELKRKFGLSREYLKQVVDFSDVLWDFVEDAIDRKELLAAGAIPAGLAAGEEEESGETEEVSESERLLRQALGDEVLDAALNHATATPEKLDVEKLEQLGAGGRFLELAQFINEQAISSGDSAMQQIAMQQAVFESGYSVDELRKILQCIISDTEYLHTHPRESMQSKVDNYLKSDKYRKRRENPELRGTMQDLGSEDEEAFIGQVNLSNVDFYLGVTRCRSIIRDMALTNVAMSVMDDLFALSPKPFYLYDWGRANVGGMLGDNHADRKKVADGVIKRIGWNKNIKGAGLKGVDEKLKAVLEQAEKIIQSAIDDADEIHARYTTLETKKTELQEAAAEEVAVRARAEAKEKADSAQRDKFHGSFRRAAAVKDLRQYVDIDAQIDASAYYTDKPDPSSSKKGKKQRSGSKAINAAANEVVQDWRRAETYLKRLIAKGVDEEDIVMERLADLPRLKEELGGTIYESFADDSRGYLIWVFEYLGGQRAIAMSAQYGTSTRVVPEITDEEIENLVRGGKISDLAYYRIVHSHKLDEKDSRSYTPDDNKNHTKIVWQVLDDSASGRPMDRALITRN